MENLTTLTTAHGCKYITFRTEQQGNRLEWRNGTFYVTITQDCFASALSVTSVLYKERYTSPHSLDVLKYVTLQEGVDYSYGRQDKLTIALRGEDSAIWQSSATVNIVATSFIEAAFCHLKGASNQTIFIGDINPAEQEVITKLLALAHQ